MAGNQKVATENINEVILRLLKLNSGVEIDYQTYYTIIKKKLASARLVGKELPREEDELLREEFKRIKNKTGRFKVKISKVRVTAPPPSAGPERGGGGGMPPRSQGSIVKSKSGKITADNFFFQNFIDPVKVKDITEKSTKISESSSDYLEILKSSLERINKNLDSIVDTLTNINKQNKDRLEKGRKEEENKKRKSKEEELESKPDLIKTALSAITKPFQSIWDKILNFIKNVILGRILIKLVNWIADPNNQGKIRSIIRFLGDHWPTLLALYLRFGTGIGKFVGSLSRILVKGAFKLVKLTASLAARAGLKGAGKFARFLGGGKGRAIATGVGVAADVAITAGTAFGISSLFGGENKNQSEPPTQQFSGGGFVNIPRFSGGGFANFNKIFGNAAMGASIGSLFGPLGMLAGAGIGAAANSGVVKGPKGIDKVPAMLTDGEFVMSVGAVKKYGIDTLEAMNAAGGGTNIPKIVNGVAHAWGGGYISDEDIRRQAAAQSAPTGGVEGAREYKFNPNNPQHASQYELLKKRAIKKGIYKPPTEPSPPPQSPRSSSYQEPQTRRTQTQRPSGKQPSSSWWDDIFSRFSRQTTSTSQSPPNTPKPPTSSAIVKTSSSALSTNVRPPMQSIKPNMKVPGGVGNLKSLGVEMLANYLMERGFDNINAMIIAQKIDEGKKLTGSNRENYIERLRNIVDREERWQRGFGGVFDSIVGLGKESSSQKQSKAARAILEGMGSGAYQGGAIKGGWGLKKQEFKDAPKTQVMTDDKGRPFVGHKAMRNGKLVYVRGPQPGTGTTNPFEALGRMINPNAYKENDARLSRGKHREAMVNSLESLRAQGASIDTQKRMMKQMGGNLKDVENDLNYRKKTQAKIASGELRPDGRKRTGQEQMRMKIAKSQKKKDPPKQKPKQKPKVVKYNPAGGGMGGRRGSGARPSQSGTRPPSFSPNHSSKSTRTARSTLGVKK